jgi:hypothetical protein
MAKSSIELTLKQLIDLGIIKLKKKRRRRKQKRVKQYIPDNIKSDSSGMVGYSQTSPPNYLNQNTDALRLRDAQVDINTRQLEQRLQLEDAKLQLEDAKQNSSDFQNRAYDIYQDIIYQIDNKIQPIGYATDDNTGVFGATQGSDGFISQRDTQPSYPAIQNYSNEIDETTPLIQVERKERIQPQPQPQSQPKTLLERVGFRSPFKTQKLMPASALDTMEAPRGDSFSKLSVQDFDDNETDVIGMNEEFTGNIPPPTIRNRQGFRLAEVLIPENQREPPKVAGGGRLKTPQQDKGELKPLSEEKAIPQKSQKGRASNEEIEKWRQSYKEIAGEEVKEAILQSKKRADIEGEIVKLLLKKYIAIGGSQREILKSKDSQEISNEITKLKRLNRMMGKS